MMMVTIFTPTYNRVLLLKRLYKSLCNQDNMNFEWVVVDDGSVDDTREWIESIKKQNIFPINYIYQKNSGKHVAFNRAILEAKGELFLCVDSDDFLANSSVVGQIILDWDKIRNDKRLAGIISLKSRLDGVLLGKNFPLNIKYATPFELARKYHSYGERNIIYRLDYLKEYSFPVFDDEKFCPDSFISDALSKKYYMWLKNTIDVVCEYQENGLSNSFSKIMKSNPKGFCIANMQIIDMENSFKDKMMNAIRYWAFKYMAGDKVIKYEGKNKMLVRLCSLPGLLFYFYYKIRL